MKKILGFVLLITGGLMGCTTTDNANANLRNANNAGYVTSSPTPMATSSPTTNSNTSNTVTNSNHSSNMNTARNSNTNANTKGNSNRY
jgi:hypothetical protein